MNTMMKLDTEATRAGEALADYAMRTTPYNARAVRDEAKRFARNHGGDRRTVTNYVTAYNRRASSIERDMRNDRLDRFERELGGAYDGFAVYSDADMGL